jgi:long-chain fatty acid transport protein
MRRLLLTLAILCAPATAGATAIDLYGFGPRAAGMGLTGTASSEDVSSLYYNPAGVARLDGIRLSAGYQYDPTRLTLQGRDIGERSPRATQVMLGFGLKSFGRRSGLALGLHVPDYGLFGVRIRPVDEPDFVVVDQRRDRIHAMAGFGIEPVDKLQIGVAVTMFSDTLGKFGILYGTPQGATMDTKLIPTNSIHAGVRAGPFGGFTTGLAYRAQSISILDFPTDLKANVGSVSGDISLRGRTFEFFTPRQVALGEAWQSPSVQVTGDLIWSQWSRMKDPVGYSRITIVDRGGSLPPSPPGWSPEDPRFHDTVSPHLGVEWKAVRATKRELLVRAGYAFVPTPAPAPTASRNLIDMDRNVVTAGLGLTLMDPPLLTGPLTLDAHLGYAKLASRTVVRDDPTDPVGSYKAGGELLSMGLTASFRFDAAYLRH